jgi:GINS complex subunit 1
MEAAESDPGLAAQLVIHHAAAQRNKRCLLAYQNVRMTFLRSLLWKRGGGLDLTLSHVLESPARLLAHEADKSTVRSRLSPAELAFVKQYADLNLAYKTEYLDIVDVAASLQKSADDDDVGPIRELMVSVVSHIDAKDVQTERGSITLRRGERMRVLRSEVDGLIVRGWLSVLDD